jgi:hypothetical protein
MSPRPNHLKTPRKTQKQAKTTTNHHKHPLQNPKTLEKWYRRTTTAIEHYHHQQLKKQKTKHHNKPPKNTNHNKQNTQNFK